MEKIKYKKELDTAVLAAETAGKEIAKYFKSKERVIRKTVKELVSRADIESQNIIIRILSESFPEYGFLSEEKPSQEINSKPTWIIDPVDGTHNFISGIPFWGVSIGLMDESEFQAGVIYLPGEKRIFTAIKNQGAFCNGEKINVSNNQSLSDAVITYDNQFYLSNDALKNYEKLLNKAFTTRILGSAVKDLCLISEGIIDGRIWNNTKICDIAAGSVILEESGGKVTDFNGDKINIYTKQVVASNQSIHGQLLDIFKNIR